MRLPATARLDACLAKIDDPSGEGARAFTKVYHESARAEAKAAEERARIGITLGPLDGRIVSIKDLFDVAGEPTAAGSIELAKRAPAAADAPIVRRLRSAGAVIIGKTNMSEFAFSGIGINPHYGTPGNPADRARVPGGSSAGAAVSVADGMAEIAIGSDTGGSVRIPAGFCGITSFKPTQARVPRDGAVPLSFTLDTVGPLARSVADCAATDAILAGETPQPLKPIPAPHLRLAVPRGRLFAQLDAITASAFDKTLTRLAAAGAEIHDIDIEGLLAAIDDVYAKGTFAAVEAAWIHRAILANPEAEVDPIPRSRIEKGVSVAAPDYVGMQMRRPPLIAAFDTVIEDFDALILPTTPIVAPIIADLATTDAFMAANGLALRNTSPFNFFDLPGGSIPMPDANPLPAGLMVMGRRNHDHHTLRAMAGIEAALKS